MLPPHFTGPIRVAGELWTARIFLTEPLGPGEECVAEVQFLFADKMPSRPQAGAECIIWEGRDVGVASALPANEKIASRSCVRLAPVGGS